MPFACLPHTFSSPVLSDSRLGGPPAPASATQVGAVSITHNNHPQEQQAV